MQNLVLVSTGEIFCWNFDPSRYNICPIRETVINIVRLRNLLHNNVLKNHPNAWLRLQKNTNLSSYKNNVCLIIILLLICMQSC